MKNNKPKNFEEASQPRNVYWAREPIKILGTALKEDGEKIPRTEVEYVKWGKKRENSKQANHREKSYYPSSLFLSLRLPAFFTGEKDRKRFLSVWSFFPSPPSSSPSIWLVASSSEFGGKKSQ